MLLQASGPPHDENWPTSEVASGPRSNAEPNDTAEGSDSAAVRGDEQEQGWTTVIPRSPRTISNAGRGLGEPALE